MLDKHLVAQTRPLANEGNIILWKDYRVTVLQSALFRIEQNASKKFRDSATQVVWFRDMPKQRFDVVEGKNVLSIKTDACELILKPLREDCRIILNGKKLPINNNGNLLGTYRTLDEFDGDYYVGKTKSIKKSEATEEDRIKLGMGVCSKTGVAVLSDENSLTLASTGEVTEERGVGSDEYLFAYGSNYRDAVKALYLITGSVPQIPRFVLGNWWSRYNIYTDRSYLQLLNSFEEQNVPLSVATIDMDWHYSKQMEEDLHITEMGRNTPFYGGNDGWTGYTWNKRLFPDYRAFLKEIEKKNLKITLNVHPADGVRWWENCYPQMATDMGIDPDSGEWVKFDISSDKFVNAYFKHIHKPYEEDGVRFWWIDWQQGVNSKIAGLDPLWALNHYHYLDNAKNHGTSVILSRYSGVGSHRYPLGFSGDTVISWDTLKYLPEFTATATNVGYTWWSHDIGGHMFGVKNNELYLRHIQYGVFSPINRLHCCDAQVCTKEPWAYGNGAGEIAKNWLRLRHALVPYLYTASYLTHVNGRALVEPLYNEYDQPEAYQYKTEYLFGSQLLVAPVTSKANKEGFAKVKAWLPEGVWTDIFTNTEYISPKGGKKIDLYRELESIPVLIKEGGILPLSLNKGNGCDNPKELQINVYKGNGEYTLYEDGLEENISGSLLTVFKNSLTEKDGYCEQTLTISTNGNWAVIPQNRTLKIRFKNILSGEVSVTENGDNQPIQPLLTDCVAIDLPIFENKEYVIKVKFAKTTQMQKIISFAKLTLTKAPGETESKNKFWKELKTVESVEEYENLINSTTKISKTVKNCLKEIL